MRYIKKLIGCLVVLAANAAKYIQKYLADGLYTMLSNSKCSVRVGKILSSVSKLRTDDDNINYAITKYSLAKISSEKDNPLIIILSRHSYDIA